MQCLEKSLSMFQLLTQNVLYIRTNTIVIININYTSTDGTTVLLMCITLRLGLCNIDGFNIRPSFSIYANLCAEMQNVEYFKRAISQIIISSKCSSKCEGCRTLIN